MRVFSFLLLFLCLAFQSEAYSEEKAENKTEESLAPDEQNNIFTDAQKEKMEEQGFIFEREQETYNNTTAFILALTLGFGVHGAGHFYSGDTRTGFTLLGMEVLSLALLSGAGLAYLSNEDENTPIIAPLFQSGFALFVFSYLADVAGSVSGSKAALALPPKEDDRIDFSALYNFTSSRGSPYRHALNARLGLDTEFFMARAETTQEVFLETAVYQGRAQGKLGLDGSRSKIAAEVFVEYLIHSGRGPFSKSALNGRFIGELDLGDLFNQLRTFSVGVELGFGSNWWSFADSENKLEVQKQENTYPVDFYATVQLSPRLYVKGGYGYSKSPVIASITPLLGVFHLESSFRTTENIKLLFELQAGDGFSGALGASIRIF